MQLQLKAGQPVGLFVGLFVVKTDGLQAPISHLQLLD